MTLFCNIKQILNNEILNILLEFVENMKVVRPLVYIENISKNFSLQNQ